MARLWLLLASISFAGTLAAAELVDEPYNVFVVEDSYIYCGPSSEFYRTDRVRVGDKLEVYIEAENDWLGIRPTETSFCWLPAEQVKLDKNGIDGQITAKDAVAWIGTNLGQARKYRWQVKFKVGEQVAVIGETERETATGERALWYRIVPPPGEFRWIHKSQIAADREQLARVLSEPKRTQQDQPPQKLAAAEPAAFDANLARKNAQHLSDSQNHDSPIAQVSYQSIPTRPIQSDLQINNQVRIREINSSEQTEKSGTPSPWVPADRMPLIQRSQQNPGISTNITLNQLQIEFARLIAAGGDHSRMHALKLRVQSLLKSDRTVDQGKAQLLIERINKYVGAAAATGSTFTPAAGAFLGQGWLQKVYSSRPDAPPYALTDRQGKTLAYVTPAIGMNVFRYLNKRVNVGGRSSAHAELGTPHFIADRFVAVDK